jgi:hypothetical protein
MNRIEFVVKNNDDVEFVDIFIDGVNLVEILKEHESPFAGRIAGDYMGLPPEIVFLPSRHFLGEPVYELDFYEGKSAILGCKCGVIECWPFVAKITVNEEMVTWSDFEQPHRGPESAGGYWNYNQLGPFVFDRKQYEEALKKK